MYDSHRNSLAPFFSPPDDLPSTLGIHTHICAESRRITHPLETVTLTTKCRSATLLMSLNKYGVMHKHRYTPRKLTDLGSLRSACDPRGLARLARQLAPWFEKGPGSKPRRSTMNPPQGVATVTSGSVPEKPVKDREGRTQEVRGHRVQIVGTWARKPAETPPGRCRERSEAP